VPASATRRPDNHNHPLSEIADRDEALLSMIEALVRVLDKRSCENLRSISEVQAALHESSLPLCRIERDRHILCRYNKV
jgi:hypothetical protein